MATLTLALVRCYGSFCRAFVGHAADPRHQLLLFDEIAAVLPRAERNACTRCTAIATVLR